MEQLYVQTPVVESLPLSRILGIPVYLKIEAVQPSGSFKNRGIGRLCAHYAKEGKQAFVSASGGNAGLATAYSGRKLGIPVKVIVPKSVSEFSRKKIEAEGADVIVHGKDLDEADLFAKQLAIDENAAYIPAFDHPLIWEGHSTLVYEIFGEGYKPGAILLSVGGGGMLCGVLEGLHQVKWQDVPVITAETEGAAAFAASVYADRPVVLDKVDTIATTLASRRITEQAFLWTKKHTIYPQIVTDKAAVNASIAFAEDHRILVEPASGASLSLAYDSLPLLKTFPSILIIVCGGAGVSCDLLRTWHKKC